MSCSASPASPDPSSFRSTRTSVSTSSGTTCGRPACRGNGTSNCSGRFDLKHHRRWRGGRDARSRGPDRRGAWSGRAGLQVRPAERAGPARPSSSSTVGRLNRFGINKLIGAENPCHYIPVRDAILHGSDWRPGSVCSSSVSIWRTVLGSLTPTHCAILPATPTALLRTAKLARRLVVLQQRLDAMRKLFEHGPDIFSWN